MLRDVPVSWTTKIISARPATRALASQTCCLTGAEATYKFERAMVPHVVSPARSSRVPTCVQITSKTSAMKSVDPTGFGGLRCPT